MFEGKSFLSLTARVDSAKEKMESGKIGDAKTVLKKEKLSTDNIEKMITALDKTVANAAMATIMNHGQEKGSTRGGWLIWREKTISGSCSRMNAMVCK